MRHGWIARTMRPHTTCVGYVPPSRWILSRRQRAVCDALSDVSTACNTIAMAVMVLIPSVVGPIARGSGVVTGGERAHAPLGHMRVWFEGNLNGAVNLERWADRVHCAADRMLSGYPTTAVRDLPGAQFQAVAFYDPGSGIFDWQVPYWRSALSEWLGRSIVDEDIETSLALHESKRAMSRLRSGAPQERMMADLLSRHGPANFRGI